MLGKVIGDTHLKTFLTLIKWHTPACCVMCCKRKMTEAWPKIRESIVPFMSCRDKKKKVHGLIMKILETLLLLVSIILEKNAAEETTLLLKEGWRDHNARFLLLTLSSIIYKVNYDYQCMEIKFNKK